nr:MAG TPA: hypothetical protein [Caudoviricetes sp.]DAJ92062.1 MAG TPA: hypothetical protein [Caudoviricetes sp.]
MRARVASFSSMDISPFYKFMGSRTCNSEVNPISSAS